MMAKTSKEWTTEKLFKALENYVEDFRKLNPKWIEAGLAQHLYESVYGLWRYIQSDEETEISWEFPAVMLYYPVVMDWTTFPDYPKRSVFSKEEKPEGPITKDSIESYGSIFGDGFFRAQKGDVLALITREIIWIIEGYDEDGEEIGRYLLPPSIHEELEGLPEEEGLDKIEALSHYGFEFSLGGQDSFFFEIHPLAVDPIKKEAYYRTFVGFNFHELDPKDLSLEQQEEFMEVFLRELEKWIPKTRLPKRLRIEAFPQERTFAIPSHEDITPLFGLFFGKKTLREKSAPFDEIRDSHLDENGREVVQKRRSAIITDNPRIKAEARIENWLFSGNIEEEEKALAGYIDKTFGPEGFRHLLGLMIGLEEAGRNGAYEFDVNEHLERLGYERKKNGAFDNRDKENARRLMFIFGTLALAVEDKRRDREIIRADKFFNIEGIKIEKKGEWVIADRITITATDWYKRSFMTGEGGQQFSKLLRDIAQESHRDHKITLALAPLFAIDWRRTPSREIKKKVKTLFEILDIRIDYKLRERTRKLEAELNYMKARNYLGDWTTRSGMLPSEGAIDKDILEEVITFTPPEWLRDEFAKIKSGKDTPRITGGASIPPMSKEEFLGILKRSGLNQRDFAKKIDKSPALISQIKKGRPISRDVARAVREVFPE